MLDNAGSGGPAYSGDAVGGKSGGSPTWHGRKGHDDQGNSGNAYTGVGGNSPGGSVNNGSPGLINLFSGKKDIADIMKTR